MIYLDKEQILQKIQESRTPYWVLYQLLNNGRRSASPLDYNDPDNTDGSEEEKIAASVEKLENTIDFFTKNLQPGASLYLYIVLRPNKKSNGETSRFEYNIKITKQTDTPLGNANYPNHTISAPPLGYIPKEVLDEKMATVEERIRLAVREENLKRREEELERLKKEYEEKMKEFDKQSEIVSKGVTKAMLKIGEAWADGENSSGLSGIDTDTPHYRSVEQLAEYIYEQTADEKEVAFLKKYVERFIDKIKQKNGISNEEKNN